MNVLLVLPPVPIALEPLALSKEGVVDAQFMYPLGLGYLSAVLRNHGHRTSVMDLQLEQLETRKEPEEIINDHRRWNSIEEFGLIGISSMTCTYPYARKLAQIIKGIHRNTKVVLGGTHVTFVAREALMNPEIDFVIRGEGEYALLELATAIQRKSAYSGIRGLSYKVKGEYRENPVVFIENLDELPFPDREVLNHESRLKITGKTPIIGSRGCPIGCKFCSVSAMWGFRYRARSPENIIAEIESLIQKYRKRSFTFYDDTFNLIPQRTEKICNLLIEKTLDIKFTCNVRASTLTKEACQKLKEAGCEGVFVGVESGNPRTLQMVGKKAPLEEIKKGIRNLQKADIKVSASFIIGLPGENKKAVMNTIRFAERLKPDSILFSSYTLFPGTEHYNNREKYGIRIIEPDLTEYFGITPVVETCELGAQERRELYVEAVMRARAHYSKTQRVQNP